MEFAEMDYWIGAVAEYLRTLGESRGGNGR